MGVESAVTDRGRVPRARLRATPLTPGEIAWLLVPPCALATFVAVLVAGPVLGRALFSPSGEFVFPGVAVAPEPVEHGRYVVALLGPLLTSVLVVLIARRGLRFEPRLRCMLVGISQWAVVGGCAYCFLAGYGTFLGVIRLPWAESRFFTPPTLAIAAAFALLLAASLRLPAVAERLAAWTRETPSRAIFAATLATVATADWLLRAVNSDATIGGERVLNLVPWEMSESFAVLDGRTTLVDFHAMYSHLWSYVGAATLALAGATASTWTITMAALSGLGVLAIFALLRRIIGSSLLALVLYLPFMAIGFWFEGSRADNGTSISNLFSIWPLRYAGPYMLAWLTARHVAGTAPRRTSLLFVAAGLVLINNLEFGIAGVAATCVAVLLTQPRRWRSLAASVAGGLLGAGVLVASLTLVRAGRLPHFEYLLEFPHLFGIDGWGLQPMTAIGIHLTLYGTFAAAIVVAVVRALREGVDPVLTGMLGWAGAFGLLAGTYFLGRSEPGTLVCLFSAWSLALALLLVAVADELVRRERRPVLPELAVMFAFGLGIASLASTPLPWEQVARLRVPVPPPLYKVPLQTGFVAAHTTRGERVAIFAPLGHRIAYDAGLENVSPYVNLEAIRTPTQLRFAVTAVKQGHVHRIFLKTEIIGEESGNLPFVRRAFTAIGFRQVAREAALTEMTDARATGAAAPAR